MVNEVNKPANDSNAALSDRLAASNRQLHEMQEEHRQLLLEMQTLRQRAAELSRLNEIQQEHRQQLETAVQERQAALDEHDQQGQRLVEQPHQQQEENATEVIAQQQQETNVQGTAEENRSEETPLTNRTESPTAEANSAYGTTTTTKTPTTEEEDKDAQATAAYLQEKLAEIANLKTQFKRVQNMIDTTKIIEEHITNKEAQATILKAAKEQQERIINAANSRQHADSTTTAAVVAAAPTPTTASTEPTACAERDESEALLNTMLHMFTDFTTDLRGQAESLRAERDRIRLLKEDIMKRKQQPK